VYYGGEIGMEDIPDPINFSRSPMQWDDTKHAGTKNSKVTFITKIFFYLYFRCIHICNYVLKFKINPAS